MKCIAIPLFKIEVDYVVRDGRRWSVLEHLVLWACNDGGEAKALAKQTGMPLRLISEVLLNLLQAGWVEFRIGGDKTLFTTTVEGRRQSVRPIPEYLLELKPRSAVLYVERLTGRLFRNDELEIKTRSQFGSQPVTVLEPRVFTADASGQLIERLPLRQDECFETWRGRPRVVPVDLFAIVGEENGYFSGLPQRASASLGVVLAEEVAARFESAPATINLAGALLKPLANRGELQPITMEADDFVVGGEETFTAVKNIIDDADRIIIIHSTFIGKWISKLLPSLLDAVDRRKVQLYINWGKKDDPERIVENPSDVAARLAFGSRTNVVLGQRTTGSHAKLVIADVKGREGEYIGLIGSCNWLDSPYEAIEASLRIRDPHFLAHIAQSFAGLIAPSIDVEPVAGRLLAIHHECTRQSRGRGTHRAMLVIDEDHYAAVRDAMLERQAGETVTIGSHKIGHAGEVTVFEPLKGSAGAVFDIVYSKVIKNYHEALHKRVNALADTKATLRRSERKLHAKFVVWSENVLLTSFNILSGSPAPGIRGAEMGVLVNGPGVAEWFREKLAAQAIEIPIKANHRKRARRRRYRRHG